MSVFLLFLIVLTSICFSTIFLMEQKPEESNSSINKPSSISSQKNSTLTVVSSTKDRILQESNSI